MEQLICETDPLWSLRTRRPAIVASVGSRPTRKARLWGSRRSRDCTIDPGKRWESYSSALWIWCDCPFRWPARNAPRALDATRGDRTRFCDPNRERSSGRDLLRVTQPGNCSPWTRNSRPHHPLSNAWGGGRVPAGPSGLAVDERWALVEHHNAHRIELRGDSMRKIVGKLVVAKDSR